MITINSAPPAIAPAYTPLWFTVESDNQTEPNFKFIYEILVGGQTIKIKQSAQPDGKGLIDVHRIVENYISSNFSYGATNLFSLNTNSHATYTVRFGEEYGATGAIAEHLNLVSSAKTAWNSAPEFIGEWQDMLASMDNYIIGHTTTGDDDKKRFLTNAPKTQSIGINQRAFLYFINAGDVVNSSLPGYLLQVYLYDESGAQVSTQQSIQNEFHAVNNAYKFARVAVGPADLVAFMDFTGVASYTVQLLDAGTPDGSPVSEKLTYVIDDLCTRYNIYRFHFLNKLGGFDAFNFLLKDTLTTDIARTTFEKISGRLSGGAYSYADTDRGTVTTNINFTDKVKVESDWITDEEAAWLKELMTSPEVYLEDEAGKFLPITLSVTSHEVKRSAPGEKLHNISIEYNLNPQTRQRF